MRPEFDLAMAAARRAGAITLKYYGGHYQVADKGNDNPVTSADLAANAYLSEALQTPYPEYGWLSEETVDDPQRLQRDRVWIVDPIDGTKEFLAEIPEYVVSIALVEKGEPIVGVIYNPPKDELYAAVKGGGTFLNGQRVFCTDTPSLDQATMIVSRSETKRGEIDPFRPHLQAIEPVGSVAYKLAVVAGGGADLNISVQPKNEWDVVAGDLLVREAGGHMLDLAGQVRRYNQADPLIRGGLAAGNPQLTAAALQLIAEAG
ncbi:MAG: 3'(2'),5'-bisphosphate nucleotidase CysQ [Candidatus Latescibacteria bacterium]|nr:3'(2'),5'-bisphosphate nucleotidase CysQ [Candidatus Latescibacterota bacterium]